MKIVRILYDNMNLPLCEYLTDSVYKYGESWKLWSSKSDRDSNLLLVKRRIQNLNLPKFQFLMYYLAHQWWSTGYPNRAVAITNIYSHYSSRTTATICTVIHSIRVYIKKYSASRCSQNSVNNNLTKAINCAPPENLLFLCTGITALTDLIVPSYESMIWVIRLHYALVDTELTSWCSHSKRYT